MDELRNAIALLFRRKGADALTEREFVLSASMDLRWFPPRDAQKLLQLGLDLKLLRPDGGSLRPTFDLSAVEVPRDFVPTARILDVGPPPAEDVFLKVVDALAAATKSDRRTAIAAVNAVQERMDVEVEVAALVAAHRAGVDVRPYLVAVQAKLRSP